MPQYDSQDSIEGTLIRGGTSKGLYVREEKLPADENERRALILELFGSPDPLQVDGIGGGISSTSKIMVVDEWTDEPADLAYDRGQVSVTEPKVGWDGNCGNLTSGVGVFAIHEGIVTAEEPVTEIKLYNRSTDTIVTQQIPVTDGEPLVYGDFSIDGVPGTGAKITSEFHDPSGNSTESLLPSGNTIDTITVRDRSVDVSIVDATSVITFVRASDFGLRGDERPDELSDMEDLMRLVDEIKLAAADHVGYDGKPHLAFISEPMSYECTIDKHVKKDDIDITSRIISLQPHHAHAMSGAMCLTAATQIPGTIPNEAYDGDPADGVTIGHPKGTLTLDVSAKMVDDQTVIESLTNYRTARPLMDGAVFHRDLSKVQGH